MGSSLRITKLIIQRVQYRSRKKKDPRRASDEDKAILQERDDMANAVTRKRSVQSRQKRKAKKNTKECKWKVKERRKLRKAHKDT